MSKYKFVVEIVVIFVCIITGLWFIFINKTEDLQTFVDPEPKSSFKESEHEYSPELLRINYTRNEKSKNKISFDFTAPCETNNVTANILVPHKPMASSDLALLRGCLVLLYFRTPRSGSTAVYFLLGNLSKRLGFDNVLGRPFNNSINAKNWRIYVNNRTIQEQPVAVSGHWRAMDLNVGTRKPPVVFNIIRHPVDHLISIYKLKKYGDRPRDVAQRGAHHRGPCRNYTLDDFIMTKGVNLPCIMTHFLALQFLCGICPNCTKDECLQRAKYKLEKDYLIVGISENIPAFLVVMETLLPQFFTGALQTYVNMDGVYNMFSPDPYRDATVNATTLEYLSKELKQDLDLYYHVQAKFYTFLRKVLIYRTFTQNLSSANLDEILTHVREGSFPKPIIV